MKKVNHFMVKNGTIMKMKQLRKKNGRMMELKQMRRNSSRTKSIRFSGWYASIDSAFYASGVSPSSTSAPSATTDDETHVLVHGQKDTLGRVMIEPDGST
ncbi:hypothetical protein EJD97_002115 [Solanum chilense]|uniref:Uncharacterized protein n=1 Tax=Solanum chilense TaxID=4083 RepID=A0A6N2C3X8_SOLCI|nr:hypothetical protein EJD97_002115 [Solanum chilense]